jgi:hypothetical protein
MTESICKQCGGNHYITKMQSTRVAHTYKGENFYDYEKVQVNCPSCTQPEPLGLDQVAKEFYRAFNNVPVEPKDFRKKGLL